jgi:2,3-diketo-5-methylthio-1-phosphopentane phosphatase
VLDQSQGDGEALPTDPDIEAVLDYLHRLMDADRKVTGLKSLQGRIWRAGYESGELKGHVYDDVPVALARWNEAGRPVFIYSSGSVAAQRLLFASSEAGDLTPLISGYYDTLVGPKTDPDSYTKIVESVGMDAETVLFATDKHAEAVAADEAGLQVLLLTRPGNAPLPDDHGFDTAPDFNGIG